MPYVAFGQDKIEFDLAPGDTLTEKEPGFDAADWPPDAFLQSLKRQRFGELVALGKILVVVNDAFRPTPTGQILSFLKMWFPDFRADFIVACGNHPPPTPTDMAAIFAGHELPKDVRVSAHNSRDLDSLRLVGELDGHPLYLNRLLFEYPAVLTIGSVEPHYFAGFTGGRKSLIPGLSDIESCRRNHALAVSPEARPLRLKGNPVAEHFDRLLTLVKIPNLLSIQVVAARGRQIINCFAGDIERSFAEAVVLAEQVYSFTCPRTYDLVIAEMHPPLDRNLYQLQKAIENTAAAVRDGGTVLVVSKCGEGIGNDEFYNLAVKLDSEETMLSYVERNNPPLGIHKLSRVVRLARRIGVKALTGLKHEILRQVFIEPALSVDAEIRNLRQEDKKTVDILLVRDAGLLVAKLD
jgi:lactate racemase